MKTLDYTKLSAEAVKPVVNALQQLLADYQIYYSNLRGFHWNVKGKDFFVLHKQYEEMYDNTAEKVDEIANDMYSQYCDLMDRQGFPDSVRCVYSVGELADIDVKSTHGLLGGADGYDKVMLNVGRFLDESDEPGIFKI